MYNAIAIDSRGMMRRRGLEKPVFSGLSRLDIHFNDELSKYHAVEPYTYNKCSYHQKEAFYEAHPEQKISFPFSSESSSARSEGYTDYRQNRGLLPYEKAELDRAKRKYENAVSRASYHRGDKVKTGVYDDAEKRAHADYLRVLAKYSGRQ